MTDADLQAVYDFEGLIPTAIAAAFTANGFDAGTALTLLSDPAFQKKRPRVEIFFTLSGAILPPQKIVVPQNGHPIQRIIAWRGTLDIKAISDVNSAAKQTHSIFRARVRNLCAILRTLVNGTSLTRHNLQSITETGTQVNLRTPDGYEGSILSFNVDFTAQMDAFTALVS